MSVADSEASYSSGYTSTAGTNESWLAASDAHLYRLNGSAHGERYTRADTETRSAVIERIRTTNGTRVSLTSANYAAMDHASLFSWNSVADASRVSESREAETATANEATAELCLSLRRRSDRSVYLAGRPNLRLPAGKLRPWVVFTPETMCITNNNSRRLFIRVSKTVATGVATYRSDSLYCGRPASVRIMTEQHWIYLNLQIRKRAANKSFAGQPYVSLGSMELDCEKPIGDIRNRSMRDRQSRPTAISSSSTSESSTPVYTARIGVPAHLKEVTFRYNKAEPQGRNLGEYSVPLSGGELLYRYGASDVLRTPSRSSFPHPDLLHYVPYNQSAPSERSISPHSSASQPRRSSRVPKSPATSSMRGSRGTGRGLKMHTVSSDASAMPEELVLPTRTSRTSSRKGSKVAFPTRSASPAVVPPSRPTSHHAPSASFINSSDPGYRVDVGASAYALSNHSAVLARSPSRGHSAPVSYRRRSPPTSSRAPTIDNRDVYIPRSSSRPHQRTLWHFSRSAGRAIAKGLDFLIGKVPGGIDPNMYYRLSSY